MLNNKFIAATVLSLLVSVPAAAKSLEVASRLDSSATGSGGIALNRGPSPEEAKLGVLVIPTGSANSTVEVSSDSVKDTNYVGSLGFAKVPLPATAWLFGTAVVGIIAVSRRRPGRNIN